MGYFTITWGKFIFEHLCLLDLTLAYRQREKKASLTWKLNFDQQRCALAQRACVSHVRRAAFSRLCERSCLTEDVSSSTRRERMKFISVDKHSAHESSHWFNVTGTESPGQIHLLSPAWETWRTSINGWPVHLTQVLRWSCAPHMSPDGARSLF